MATPSRLSNQRYLLPKLVYILVVLQCGVLPLVRAASGIREVGLNLKSLVYDPFTQKLYGSATNDLAQIDPDSGQILATFPLGTNVTYLSLGAGNGIWIAIDGEH